MVDTSCGKTLYTDDILLQYCGKKAGLRRRNASVSGKRGLLVYIDELHCATIVSRGEKPY
jgi:hypothetical protein